MFVSANYFRTIGLPLARGAGFDQIADDPLAAAPVVIVGYDYWQHDLGADPNIIGKTLTLDDIPHVVVGVAPQHFSGHLGFQERRLFLPLGRYAPLRTNQNMRADRGNDWLTSLAGSRPASALLRRARRLLPSPHGSPHSIGRRTSARPAS